MSVPPEPNRRIEELLKAYAEQRRKAAGESLQMSERTRNLLLRAAVRASVARQAAEQTPSWHDRLLNLWPRLAVGVGVAAAVLVVAVMMQSGGKKPRSLAELAEMEPKVTPIAAIAPVPEPPPAAAQTSRPKPTALAASADRRTLSPAKPKTQPAEVVTAEDAIKALGDRRKPAASAPPVGEAVSEIAAVKTKNGGAPAEAVGSETAKIKAGKPHDPVVAQSSTRLANVDKAVVGESLARKEQEPAAVGVKLAMKDVPNLPAPAAPVAEAAPAARPATVAIAPAPETPLGRAKKAEVAAIPAATVAQPAGATAGPQVASNLAESNLRLAFQNAPSQAAQGSRRSQMRFTQIPLRRDSMVAERSQAAQQQVMASFQLEQDGDRIIIRDADGSTYEGQVQTAPAIESEKLADGKVAKTAQPTWDISTQAAGQQVFFTLSGTNRSLNQRVEFHGNLTLNQPWQRASGEPAREIGVMGAQQPGSAKEAAAPVVLRVQSPRMPSRVQGRARLGDGSELDINAISVGP